MDKPIKGIVRPPMKMPAALQGQRSKRAIAQRANETMPLAILLYAWFCFVRAAVFLAFGMIIGLSGADAAPSVFLATHFDAYPRLIQPEIIFYLLALIYGVIGWRWFIRDWKARWLAMMFTGLNLTTVLGSLLAYRMAGIEVTMAPMQKEALVISVAWQILVLCYLAFYPGMEQAFQETPWE